MSQDRVYLESQTQSISSCTFDTLSGTNGGAIYGYSSNIAVAKSYFVKCSATIEGGAIFCENGKLFLSSSCFLECKACTTTNEKGGNAILLNMAEGNIDQIAAYRCWHTTSDTPSDSLIIARKQYFSFKRINSTYNYGILGASLCSIWTANAGSYVEYSYCKDSVDYNSVETVNGNFIVRYSNFINTTKNSKSVLFSQSGTLTCNYCYLYNPHTTVFYGTCVVTNCYSDATRSSCVLISSSSVNDISVFMNAKNCVAGTPVLTPLMRRRSYTFITYVLYIGQ